MIYPLSTSSLTIFLHSHRKLADGHNFPGAKDPFVFSTLSQQKATSNVGPLGLLAQPRTRRPTGKPEGIANFV